MKIGFLGLFSVAMVAVKGGGLGGQGHGRGHGGGHGGGAYVAGTPYVTGTYTSGAYNPIGTYNTAGYSALALQSSAANVNSYNFEGPFDQGIPAPPIIGHGQGPPFGHGKKHGKHAKIQHVPTVEDVQVEEFVSTEGPVVENQLNRYNRVKKYTVTHRPVYHKTVVNHYTAHDRINKEVVHHLGEKEARYFDVAGKEVYGGSVQVQHGDVGHAAYPSIVGAATGGTGVTAGSINPIVEPTQFEYNPIQAAQPLGQLPSPAVGSGPFGGVAQAGSVTPPLTSAYGAGPVVGQGVIQPLGAFEPGL